MWNLISEKFTPPFCDPGNNLKDSKVIILAEFSIFGRSEICENQSLFMDLVILIKIDIPNKFGNDRGVRNSWNDRLFRKGWINKKYN